MTGRIHESQERPRSLWKGPAIITVLLVLIPLIASRLVEGWHWGPGAFVFLGGLIFGISFAYQLMTRNRNAIAYRAGMAIALVATFALCWGNLVQWADVNPAAAMYFGVPIVLVIGAAIARLRPNAMAGALFATALVQASAFTLVLTTTLVREPNISFWTPPELRGFAGNAINLIMFVAAALLFRKAGRQRSTAGS